MQSCSLDPVTGNSDFKEKGRAPGTSLARGRQPEGLDIPLAHKAGEVDLRQKPLLVAFLEEEVRAVAAVEENQGPDMSRESGHGGLSGLLHPSGWRKLKYPKVEGLWVLGNYELTASPLPRGRVQQEASALQLI